MSVTLPSDLIADVMRNANPAKVRTAMSRLEPKAADPASNPVEFRNALTEAGIASAAADPAGSLLEPQAIPQRAEMKPGHLASGETSPFVAFEQMFLRNMLESMMPPASSGIYGDDTSGNVWRSVAADQLAGVYAKAGGLGLAKELLPAGGAPAPVASRQWPYFEFSQIAAFAT